ncbi:thioredoxin family protein [Desertivirga brevis]|uniref:thioredoxin family protein n=1 Tax=Desertivirga brevis TaxID=2810310 RepID=UPI001A96406A|nr:thioredoxin family protein [Pedobacter sp. SYSU D00873]
MKNLLLLCLLITGLIGKAQTSGYKTGDIASDFKLKNVDGKLVSLSDYKAAKGYIVIFTCNTCPYAIAYEERIKELNQKYASKGYPVIAINPNDPGTQPGDSFEKMQERAKEKSFNFPYLFDTDEIVTKQFGASRTPHVYILQKTNKGNIVEYIGAIDDDTEGTRANKVKYVEAAIDALSRGKKPEIANTKAIGCTIKWKKQGA